MVGKEGTQDQRVPSLIFELCDYFEENFVSENLPFFDFTNKNSLGDPRCFLYWIR